jgi:hypothetical protein
MGAMRALLVALAILVALPAVAAAQSAPLPITMDRLGEGNRLGVELAFVPVEFVGEDFYAARLDLGGHFMGPNGFGGFADVAVAQTFGKPGDEASAVDDLELGGFYRLPLRSGALWFRGAFAADTATDDLDLIANVLSAAPRLTDLARVVPTSWLRLSVSPVFRSGPLTLRADLGADVPLDSDDADSFLRANVGFGYDAGRTSVLFELVTLISTNDSANETVTTATLGARFGGQVDPYVGLGIPLDEALRDDSPLFLIFGLSPWL